MGHTHAHDHPITITHVKIEKERDRRRPPHSPRDLALLLLSRFQLTFLLQPQSIHLFSSSVLCSQPHAIPLFTIFKVYCNSALSLIHRADETAREEIHLKPPGRKTSECAQRMQQLLGLIMTNSVLKHLYWRYRGVHNFAYSTLIIDTKIIRISRKSEINMYVEQKI